MTVEKDKVVAIEYCVKDSGGGVLDSSEGMNPLEYIHGHNMMIPGLEKELEGRQEADSFDVVVEPADGYGEYNENLVIEVERNNFPDEAQIKTGARFEAESPSGPVAVTVTHVADDMITVDANHPLAGKRLFFSVKIVSVRDATREEIAREFLRDTACGGGCSSCRGCH
jgi:FKBP-type peptidyl-prolyl cis-trans isomerase SlyD